MRMPYVANWSAGLQWGLANNWLLETVYQGQAGVGLINSWDVNAIPLNISSDPAMLNSIFQATQNYKPYPQFGSINFHSNFSHNTYHSGTVRVEKRLSSGLTLTAFYTLQKALSDAENEGGASGITFITGVWRKAGPALPRLIALSQSGLTNYRSAKVAAG